jgi:hypothetical protein
MLECEVNQWDEIYPQGLLHFPLDSLKESIALPIGLRAKVLIDMNLGTLPSSLVDGAR